MQINFLRGALLVLATVLVASSARKTDSEDDNHLLSYSTLLDTFRIMGLWDTKEYLDSEDADTGVTLEDVNKAEEMPSTVEATQETTSPVEEPVTEKVIVKKKTKNGDKSKRRKAKSKKRPKYLEEKYDDVRFGANGVDGVDTKAETSGLEYSGGRAGQGAEGTEKFWGGDGGDGGNGNRPPPLEKPKSDLKLTGKPVWTKQSNTTSNSAKLEKTASNEKDYSWWWHPDGSGRKEVATDATNTKRSAGSNKTMAQIEGYQNGVKSNIDSVQRKSTQQSGRNVTAERGDERIGDVRIISMRDLITHNNDETAGRLRKTGEHIRLDDGEGSDTNYVSNATSSRGVATAKEDINQITDLKGVEVLEQSKRDGLSSYRTADRNDVANKTLIVKKNRKNKRKKATTTTTTTVTLPVDE